MVKPNPEFEKYLKVSEIEIIYVSVVVLVQIFSSFLADITILYFESLFNDN